MPDLVVARPASREYAPYYARYVDLVPDGDVLGILERQLDETLELLSGITPERASYRYAVGKWSIKEVIGHVMDVERVFVYRALCFARNDPTPLPGFEQDDYVAVGNYDGRSLPDIAGEYRTVRVASLAFLQSLDPEAAIRRGVASGVEFTVRTIPYILAGHERHHLNIIRERYLKAK
ncbi:MAG: DUF664 domain-containing protein [Gemmatimonadales bacterium]|nr:DUF664 domain-containing protein [Gemmatimonadales bacterium]NIN48665.1 DUF664 domain-containing protein [Gemmatimonadales bacterium]NIP06129.1 DUF664 domain-containing protein [Gemmatimonadales bacterium]NIR01303.1 DUF664 domain-containing protein [Gemmatimonadales bacterium]